MLLPDLGGDHAPHHDGHRVTRTLRRALTSTARRWSPGRSSCRSSSCSAAARPEPLPVLGDGPGLHPDRAQRRDRHRRRSRAGTSGSPTSSSPAAPTSARCSRRAWRRSRRRSPAATTRSAWSRFSVDPGSRHARGAQRVRRPLPCGAELAVPHRRRATRSRRSCATASSVAFADDGPRGLADHAQRPLRAGRPAAPDPRLLPRQRSRRRHAPGRRRAAGCATIPRRERSARRPAAAPRRPLVEGRHEVLDPEPEAARVPEEQHRREQHDRGSPAPAAGSTRGRSAHRGAGRCRGPPPP